MTKKDKLIRGVDENTWHKLKVYALDRKLKISEALEQLLNRRD